MKKTIYIIVMAVLCAFLPAKTQLSSTQGRVTDEHGNALPGTTITLKNNKKSFISDNKGIFILKDIREGDILIISRVGYQTIDIKYSKETPITIRLNEDASALKEVQINAGYYMIKDKERTGSIAKVTSETISKQPVSNVLQALQGRMTGVVVTQQTGAPGGGFTVQVRGQNSLRTAAGDNGNLPLYLIDGVPFTSTSLASGAGSSIVGAVNPLNSINPNDIASIEVLKDADATSIYGSRGANGVILITTKKNKTNQSAISFDMYSGIGTVPRFMNLLNTDQYIQMRKEAFSNDAVTPTLVNAPDLIAWDTTRYTDWQKELIGGTMHKTNLNSSISGGSLNTRFLLSGNYYRESTVFPGDFAYQKASSRISIDHTPNEKFSIFLNASYGIDANNVFAEDLITTAVMLTPNAPALHNSVGALNWENSTWTNPLAALQRKYSNNTTNFSVNSVIHYQISSMIGFKTSMGTNRLQLEEHLTQPMSANDPATPTTGNARFGEGYTKSWIIEPQIDLKTSFGQHRLNFLLGATFQQNIQDTQYIGGTGYTSDALLDNIKSAPSLLVLASNYSDYRYNALFSRLNYSYNDKYYFNITARRDGSSRFGPGKQFGNFGALGAAWIFSKESFFSKIPFVSFGKLRASYGITGNDQIPDYGYLNSYTSNAAYQGGTALIPSRLANSDYAWETNKKLEAALELELFNGRIGTEINWYRNRSSNQLVGYSLSGVTGFITVQSNLPALIQNTGVEIVLNGAIIKGKDFKWDTGFNITFPQTKLLAYPNITASSYANTYVVGNSLFTTKRNNILRVDPVSGIYVFVDRNGDGSGVGTEDRGALVKLGQDFYGGLQNSINIKGWSLDFFFQFVKQTGRNYMFSAPFSAAPGRLNNQPVYVLDRWQKSGDQKPVQKFTQSTSSPAFSAYTTNRNNSDNVISDASFIRLQNLSISKVLPSKWTDRLKIKTVRLYAQGQNLFTITNYKGFDPENQTAGNIPPLRVFTAGIQLSL